MFTTWFTMLVTVSFYLTPVTADIVMVTDRDGNPPTNPEPCLRICTGATGFGKTAWLGTKAVRIRVDMSACQFVTTPSVTTTLDGMRVQAFATGVTSLYQLTNTSFLVYVHGPVHTSSYKDTWILDAAVAKKQKWSIMWQAIGYVC